MFLFYTNLSRFNDSDLDYLLSNYPFLRHFMNYRQFLTQRKKKQELRFSEAIVDCGVYDLMKYSHYKPNLRSRESIVLQYSNTDLWFDVPDFPADMVNWGHHNLYATDVSIRRYLSEEYKENKLIFTVQCESNITKFQSKYNELVNLLYSYRNHRNTKIGFGDILDSIKTKKQALKFVREVRIDPNYSIHLFAPSWRGLKVILESELIDSALISVDSTKWTRAKNKRRIKELAGEKNYNGRFIAANKQNQRYFLECYLESIQELM